jgi:GAF domain-containing protein
VTATPEYGGDYSCDLVFDVRDISKVCGVDDSLRAALGEAMAADAPRPVRAGSAADAIRQATDARWVGIYTVADPQVTNEGWSGPGAPAHPSFSVTEGLTAHAIRTGSVAVSNDVGRDPRYLTNQEDSGSELIVPILLEGHVVGTLDVESDKLGSFDGAAIVRYERLAAALRPLWHRD